MKLLINLSNISGGGGVQVAHSFISEINKISSNEYLIIASRSVLDEIKSLDLNSFVNVKVIETKPSPINLKARFLLSKHEKVFLPDKVFTLFGPSYWKPKSKHLCGYAIPHFLYKDSPYFKKVSFLKKLKIKVLEIIKVFYFRRDASYYVTETTDASKRLKNLLQKKEAQYYTVNNAYNSIYDDPLEWKESPILKRGDFFRLITISKNRDNKNLDIIPEVIKVLRKKYPEFSFRFTLTCDPDSFKLKNECITNHVEFIGKVSIESCPKLYQQSNALFLPTLLECFSVSYLEAMKMEIPIITSDISFARNICGDSAIYIHPLNAEEIADEIYNLANSNEMVKSLKIKGQARLKKFKGAKYRASKYLEILENI